MKKCTRKVLKCVVTTALAAGIAAGPGIFEPALARSTTGSKVTVDGVSGATIPQRKGTMSLKEKTLLSLIEYGGAAHILSTVNPDGTPHVAPITPEIDTEGNIRFVSGCTRTRQNIDASGKAVLVTYAINCGGNNAGMHMGGRLVLSRVGDQVSKDKMKSYGLRTTVLRIDKILPLEEKARKKPKAPYRR